MATWHATLTWIPVSERYPDGGAAVLVRMTDGRAVGATWTTASGWYHSPFDKWGEPVEWAALPELHRSP